MTKKVERMVLAQSGSSNVAVKNVLNMKCCANSSNRMARSLVMKEHKTETNPVDGSSNVAVKNTLNMKCCASSSNRRTQNIVKVTAATLQWSRAR